MPLSEEQQKAYIAARGIKCPACGSEQLYADSSPEIDAPLAWQDIDCTDCGASWTDVYHLAYIDNYTPKEEQEP